MMLVGVERSFAGPDLRTLECPKCELAYNALTEWPMKPRTGGAMLVRNNSHNSLKPASGLTSELANQDGF
jgi:hypothetical protein